MKLPILTSKQRSALTATMLSILICTVVHAQDQSMSTAVRRLIEETTQKDLQMLAFAKLEAMGEAAVPYMVGHLDDERLLPTPMISLANRSPDAFEGIRHYSPKTVHDALAAILNQITGQHFEFVYNGDVPNARRKNELQWKAWCIKTYPRSAKACRGSA